MSSYNDQVIATNLISSLKHLKSLCCSFSQEAGSDALYQKCESLYQNISQLQRDVFDVMDEQGWLETKSDSISSIKKAYDKYKQKESDL